MTKFVKLAFVVAGIIAVKAEGDYTNSAAPYALDMECANCIRSGNNFCLYIGGQSTATITRWDCQNKAIDPEW